MLAGSAAAGSVAAGLAVAVSAVVQSVASAAGLAGFPPLRWAAVSAEPDLTASAAEASTSPAFATGAFRSRQVWVLEAGATMTPALFGPAIIGSTSASDRATRRSGTPETLTWLFR